MKPAHRILFAIAIAILLALGGAAVWYFQFQTYHFAVVKESVLYRDGNRDLREFTHAVAKSHAKTVVTLIDERELADPHKPQFAAESQWCSANGVRQVRIPVRLGGWPTSADLQTFLQIVQNPADQPVLVHCAQGVRRTGMFVAAYQLAVEKQSPDQVKGSILRFGHSSGDIADVERFTDLFRPETRELPTTMPAATAE